MGLFKRLFGSGSLSPAEAAAGLADGTLCLVDVREPDEFAAVHAPGARPVPLGQLGAALADLAAGGLPVAFVCRSGGRSARATRQARAAGVDAHNVRGGMTAWEQAGLPTTSGRPGRR